MRVSLAFLLTMFGLLTTASADLGSKEDPHPENHGEDEEEDAEDADGEDGEDEEGDDEGEDEEEDGKGKPLGTPIEDNGEADTLTQKHMRDLHPKFDANKDGKVSMSEIMDFAHETQKKVKAKEIHAIFGEIDSTKDGHLSLEEHLSEYEAEMEEKDPKQRELLMAHEKEKFKAADTDGDDKLDKDELVAFINPELHPEVFAIHVKHTFKLQDTDGDGLISKAEWDVSVRREHEHHMDENLDHDGEFKELDANKDGSIDFKEMEHWESGRFHLENSMKKLFTHGDKDGDDHLTEHELAQLTDAIDDHHDAHAHLMEWIHHHEEM